MSGLGATRAMVNKESWVKAHATERREISSTLFESSDSENFNKSTYTQAKELINYILALSTSIMLIGNTNP
jgi:hypothetical protein